MQITVIDNGALCLCVCLGVYMQSSCLICEYSAFYFIFFYCTDICSVTTVKQKKKSKYLRRGLSLITKKYKPNIRKYTTAVI